MLAVKISAEKIGADWMGYVRAGKRPPLAIGDIDGYRSATAIGGDEWPKFPQRCFEGLNFYRTEA
jgi:hypothetical protein